ncbi:MAG TPA: alkaline phosphatase family protein [Nocardioides sp.]|uniref:alkaline phosphatase family protein n=1 Tax=Nocardioides sp. TaxID=35761 RepID=UPI002F409FF7
MSSSVGGRRRATFLGIAGTTLVALAVVLTLTHPGTSSPSSDVAARTTAARQTSPAIGHVFVVNIENKGFRTTWGPDSAAPYLARTLRAKGVLLTQYYGTAHHSLGNYLAQISGQGPDYATQHDCPVYSRFTETQPVRSPGQVVGNGCVYPRKVGTLPGQLVAAGLSWRGYMQDMAEPCQHSRLGSQERWVKATPREQYATRHNPFVYFRSITSRPSYCRAHVKPLSALGTDLRRRSTTRTLSYITPDLCHDAHDARCADGGPGGLRAANRWFRTWIPKILQSPAYRANGMLVITADESEGVREDSRACCGEGPGPNAAQPGIDGHGGGRIGALVISPYVAPGTTSTRAYNHYSLLGSIEDLFGLRRLGYARTVTHVFGVDVYNDG